MAIVRNFFFLFRSFGLSFSFLCSFFGYYFWHFPPKHVLFCLLRFCWSVEKKLKYYAQYTTIFYGLDRLFVFFPASF